MSSSNLVDNPKTILLPRKEQQEFNFSDLKPTVSSFLKFSTFTGHQKSTDIKTEEQLIRYDKLANLINFCIEESNLTGDFSIYIFPDGSIKFIASKFILNGQMLLTMDSDKISFDGLKLFRLVIPGCDEKLKILNERIHSFEKNYVDSDSSKYNALKAADYYTEHLVFVTAIFAALKKIQNVPYNKLPRLLKSFYHYWNSLPNSGLNFQSSLLINWSEDDWKLLSDHSSCCHYLNETKKLGIEVYTNIFLPYVSSLNNYQEIFDIDQINIISFFDICSIVCPSKLLQPLFGLINSRVSKSYSNAKLITGDLLVNESISGKIITHGVNITSNVEAGDEICFRDNVSNDSFAIIYNNIPVDIEMVMQNEYNHMFIRTHQFCVEELQKKHFDNPLLQEKKMTFIFNTVKVGSIVQLNWNEIKTNDSNTIKKLKYMILFIALNETDSIKTIDTSQLHLDSINYNELCVLMSSLINNSIGKFSIEQFKDLLIPPEEYLPQTKDNPLIQSRVTTRTKEMTRCAIFLAFSERVLADHVISQLSEIIPSHATAKRAEFLKTLNDELGEISNILYTLEKKFVSFRYNNICSYCGKYDINCKICSRCNIKSYCSPECQKSHFPHHKTFCKLNASKK